MACGARGARSNSENELVFKVHSKPMRYIMVTLNAQDLYDVEYFRLKRGSGDKVSMKSANGIFNDQLSEIIYDFVNKGQN